MTADEVRARIEAALHLDEPAGDWWLDEAVRRLEAYVGLQRKKRVYDVSSFGARLRTAREIHGLTQPRLGKLIDAHGFWISDWERGRHDMPIKYLRPISTALRVSEAWLLGDSTEGGPPMPGGIQRRQVIPNYVTLSRRRKRKDRARAELQRLRGLRPPKPTPAPPDGD